MRPASTLAALALTLAGSLALSSCGGADPQAGPGGTDAAARVPSQRISGDPDTWPLTGLPVTGGRTSVQPRPVLVLKMDNTPSSAPQQGLGSADMVVEELVEGGVTRLAAFYYSTVPGKVGPVRSMRASDMGIVSPVGATLVTSGAASVTVRRLHHDRIHWFTEGSPGFYRDSARSAPYNLFTTLTDVARSARQAPGRPADYLPWSTDQSPPDGAPATSVAAQFSGAHTTRWAYRGDHYVDTDGYAAPGDGFPADTVLVLRVRVGDAGYLDPAGNTVPETHFAGSGSALLFHGGRLVKGTWHKDHLNSALQLSADGRDLTVPAGHTWIELVPRGTGSVSWSH